MPAKRDTIGDVFWRATGVLGLAALLVLSSGCDLNFGVSGRPTAPPQPSAADPPSRAARLSYLEGSVSFRPAGSDVWTRAVLNRPVTTGDELWADSGGRAELDLGFAAIRLADETHFGILELSDHAFQAKLTQGTARFTVWRLENGDAFEIDTPNVSVSPSLAGEFRVEVSLKTRTTDVLTRRGETEVTNPHVAFAIPEGRSARLDGARLLKRALRPAPQPDRFDQFCQFRDHLRERAESSKYVAFGVVGTHDLDDCGIWLTNATLGAYWTPRCVPPGWAPYRFGRWAWIEPWGWTWIDDAPWGFAPFHYGRWARVEGLWSWMPGPADGQPIYAPALAAFITGPGLGRGTVAWFPLAPNEVYSPAYRCSLWYLKKLNPMAEHPDESAELPSESYANRLAPEAISAVSQAVFKSGRPVEGSLLAVGAHDASSTEVIGSFPPLVPEVQSLSDRVPPGVRVPRPPDESSAQPVVLRRSPPPAPVPFDKRLPLLRANPGQPLDRQTAEQLGRQLQP